MNHATTPHPTPAALAAFGLGQLPPPEHTEVERHVSSCPECCQALRGVPDDTLLGWLKGSPTSPPGTDTSPPPAGALATSADLPDIPPELIDHPRYRLLGTLGRGGMGVVYKAEHRLMERTVALKVISREFTDNPRVVKRFRREVKNAARLQHPNIVTAYDAEQAGDLHFLVMEFVPGRSLAQVLESNGRLPVGPACSCVRQAAAALQCAHDNGMVHRDIKPHNLMLMPRGRLKVLDFGLARLVSEDGQFAAPGGKRVTALTQLGTVVGTVPYMSPEQAANPRTADIRSDIYSLGCTLYHLLSGNIPFPMDSALQQMMAHAEKDARPLHRVRDEVPKELSVVVGRMMAKNPGQRFQTPAEVVEALAPFAKLSPPREADHHKAPPPVRPPVPLAAEVPSPDKTEVADPAPERAEARPEPPPPPRRSRPRRPRPRRQPRFLWAWALAGLGLLACLGVGIAALAWNPPGTPPEEPGDPGKAARPEVVKPPPMAPADGGRPRVLFVIAPEGFWAEDYLPVRQALEKGGAKVSVASSRQGWAVPHEPEKGHNKAQIDLLVQDADPAAYDAVIFPGAYPPHDDEYVGDTFQGKAAKKLIWEMKKKGKYVTSICIGAKVLADAGILKGVEVTCQYCEDYVKEHGATLRLDQGIHVQGRIITARGPEDAPKFAETLLDLLGKDAKKSR